MKIRNINGTSQKICKCGSWLNHWVNYSGQPVPSYCPEKSCTEKELVGAHVQQESSDDNDWYIYPLCKKHSEATGQSLDVADTYKLALRKCQRKLWVKYNLQVQFDSLT
ncbi:MAG: hypothetical protein MZV70_52425 [Desulfobacterales bacterium]|nr:hypothetical protein [Desulfobacterales bacterium]